MPKPLSTSYPRLLIEHGKHGNLYMHIPDEATLCRAALEILTARVREGWYPEPKAPEDPGFTADAIGSLPRSMQEHARQKLDMRKVALNHYLREREQWEEANRAVAEGNGKMAWRLLKDADGEYERVSLEVYCKDYT